MTSQTYLPVGIVLVAISLVSLIWLVRSKAPKHFAVQAMSLGELGLMAIAIGVLPHGPARNGATAVLGISTLLSIALYVKLARDWKLSSYRSS